MAATGTKTSALAGGAFRCVALAALLLALHWLTARGLRASTPAVTGVPDELMVAAYAWTMAAGVAVTLLPTPLRLWGLLVPSLIGEALVLRLGLLLAIGFAGVVCTLARTRLRLRTTVPVALGLWVLLPAYRASAAASDAFRGQTFLLSVFWAQLAYASLYLIVERARRDDARTTVLQDLFYLIGLPRLVEPFFQPVSSRTLWSRQRPARPAAVLVALGLAALGLAMGVAARALVQWMDEVNLAYPQRVGPELFCGYSDMASQIFVSMALFRLLGFELASGFRQPLLSSSFAEFFRRWNFYVREAVLSLFYFPMLGWLRPPRLSRRAALIVAGYAAIVVGSFVMNDLLVPFATSVKPLEALSHNVNPWRLAMLVLFWSAVVLPPVLATPRERGPRDARRPRRWLRVLRFDLVLVLVSGASRWAIGAGKGAP